MTDTKTTTANEQQLHFLDTLRSATSRQHSQLEATRISADLMKKDVDVQALSRYLAHMHGIISFCETNVFPVVTPVLPDLAERHKLPAIDADMQKIGAIKPPAYAPAAKFDTIPRALGYMYVIEGSTLGGRVLSSHLQATLGLDATSGTSFFSIYGGSTGRLWKDFLNTFTAYAVNSGTEAEIIEAGRDAFTSIQQHFSLAE